MEFIKLAEESGLIVALTDWVLQTACEHLRRPADEGLPEVHISVNLASPSFAREGLAEQLNVLLARHGLQAGSLTLEVTESMLMLDMEQAAARLQQLRERGFELSLDDFGTGYSSLTYLKQFPADELKIDRSFVRESAQGGRDSAIARSIIALGRKFGLHVVAEGVETRSQADFLVRSGCITQQGYLYAKPMPAERFDELLRRDGSLVAGGCAIELPLG